MNINELKKKNKKKSYRDKNLLNHGLWRNWDQNRFLWCWKAIICSIGRSKRRMHTWVVFAVGSRPCFERFFLAFSGCPPSTTTNTQVSNSISASKLSRYVALPCYMGKQVTLFFWNSLPWVLGSLSSATPPVDRLLFPQQSRLQASACCYVKKRRYLQFSAFDAPVKTKNERFALELLSTDRKRKPLAFDANSDFCGVDGWEYCYFPWMECYI